MSDQSGEWEQDVLPGFERRTLRLADDDEGAVVATLVRPATPGAKDAGVDLLYLHGWTDYFFQTHLAEFWEELGVRFHALDLRKYGRSLRAHQTPGYATTLRVYGEDIEAALGELGHGEDATRDRKLVLMAHSTGGLVAALWAHHHPGRADALVLNSPWLEFQTGNLGRRVLEGPVRAHAAVAPRGPVVPFTTNFYARTISSRFEGEWDYSTDWRPDLGWKPTPAWLSAIFRGHERVARGLAIGVPILVLLSARSSSWVRWSEEMKRTDAVLDVQSIARRAPNLGSLVTLVRLDGALHDVTLSAADVRTTLWAELTRWFHGYVSPPVPEPAPAPGPPPEALPDVAPGVPAWWRRVIRGPRRAPARL